MRLTSLRMLMAAVMAVWALCADAAPRKARPRTSESVRAEQRDNARGMDRARRGIDDVNARTRRRLNDLAMIESDIERGNIEIAALRARIDSTDAAIGSVNDSIAALTERHRRVSADYARALRDARDRRRSVNTFAFIFSSESFHQAWRRVNYLRQFNRQCRIKTDELRLTASLLVQQRTTLTRLREEQNGNMARLAASSTALRRRKAEGDDAVAKLKSEGKALQDELTRRRELARRLSGELDRIIEQEARLAEERRRKEAAKTDKKTTPATPAKPATAKNSGKGAGKTERPATIQPARPEPVAGNFAANRGRLLAPVEGRYKVVGTFGKGSHETLSNIIVDNPGVDLETDSGADAFAVYDGIVSSIFFLDGYRNVVILRHGDYLTVYGGLESIRVRKGDRVARGQSLGRIAPDDDNASRARLHFEVRHEKEKLNPLDWIAR